MQTLIENVNVVNPFEEISTHQNVLIEDGVIKEITSGKIKADNVIDGEDNYLLSGFIDCHTHIFAKGFHKSTMQCLMHCRQSMRALLQLGIADLPI